MDRHRELLALAGRAPDGWLLIAREALADGDTGRLEALLEVLPEEKAKARPHTFAPEPGGYEKTDRALVTASSGLPRSMVSAVTAEKTASRAVSSVTPGRKSSSASAAHPCTASGSVS